MNIEGKQSLLNKILHSDSTEEIEQRMNALGIIVRQSTGLKRLVKSPDWKYLMDVFAEVRGRVIQGGKISNDKEKRYAAFEALNAIDDIDFVISNTINKGEEALQRYNDLDKKLAKTKSA